MFGFFDFWLSLQVQQQGLYRRGIPIFKRPIYTLLIIAASMSYPAIRINKLILSWQLGSIEHTTTLLYIYFSLCQKADHFFSSSTESRMEKSRRSPVCDYEIFVWISGATLAIIIDGLIFGVYDTSIDPVFCRYFRYRPYQDDYIFTLNYGCMCG